MPQTPSAIVILSPRLAARSAVKVLSQPLKDETTTFASLLGSGAARQCRLRFKKAPLRRGPRLYPKPTKTPFRRAPSTRRPVTPPRKTWPPLQPLPISPIKASSSRGGGRPADFHSFLYADIRRGKGQVRSPKLCISQLEPDEAGIQASGATYTNGQKRRRISPIGEQHPSGRPGSNDRSRGQPLTCAQSRPRDKHRGENPRDKSRLSSSPPRPVPQRKSRKHRPRSIPAAPRIWRPNVMKHRLSHLPSTANTASQNTEISRASNSAPSHEPASSLSTSAAGTVTQQIAKSLSSAGPVKAPSPAVVVSSQTHLAPEAPRPTAMAGNGVAAQDPNRQFAARSGEAAGQGAPSPSQIQPVSEPPSNDVLFKTAAPALALSQPETLQPKDYTPPRTKAASQAAQQLDTIADELSFAKSQAQSPVDTVSAPGLRVAANRPTAFYLTERRRTQPFTVIQPADRH